MHEVSMFGSKFNNPKDKHLHLVFKVDLSNVLDYS